MLHRTHPAAPGAPSAPSAPSAPGDYLSKVQAFRDKHEADYIRDWVSIAGLHFLEPGTQTVGSAIRERCRRRRQHPRRPLAACTSRAAASRSSRRQTSPSRARARRSTGPVMMKEEGQAPAPEVLIGDVRLVAHVSGDRLALRVRDPNGPLAKDFRGFTWFPIDPQYRVVGRFIRDAESSKMTVQNTFGDMDTYMTEGVIEFELHGQKLRLRPFTSRPNRFYIVFRDASAGEETYETARFLYADLQRGWDHGAGLQRGLQPAVRVQSVHDLPDPGEGKHSAREGARRREGVSDSRLDSRTGKVIRRSVIALVLAVGAGRRAGGRSPIAALDAR